MRYLKTFENYNINDDTIGKEFWFEYHCLESPESIDAELWYRSHQRVVITGIDAEGGGDTKEERLANGEPRVYFIKFLEDGFVGSAFEDEILISPEEFQRPDPEKRKM